MILRLLLVGMVSGLGLTLPDGADLRTSLSWARTGATACAGPRAVSFEPIGADAGAVDRIAAELNQMSDGMNLPNRPFPTTARPATTTPTDAVAQLFDRNDVWAAPTAEVVNNLPKKPEAPIASTTPADAVAKLFDANDVWAGPAIEIASAPVAAPAPAPSPARFEPIAAADAPTIADDLNRDAEGLAIAPVRARRAGAEPTVGTAMKLTRDAALAWLNVLTKTTNDAPR